MFCLESMLVPLDSEVKFTSLFVRVKESSALMSELSQEKTISAMFWCERGIIFGSYISGFVKLECCSCYTYGCHSLQAVKSLFVEWQNLFPTRLTVLVQCFTKHLLKSSQSRSFSTNNFWPTLSKCMHRPQLVTSSSSQCSVSSPNLRLLKLKTNSPLKLSFTVKFHQPSSRQGRERSLSTSSFSKERIILQTSLFVRDRLIPIVISEKLFNSFTVLLSCLVVYTGPEDATRLVLVMCSGGKGWFSTSQHIQHMLTMVYESGFTVNFLLTHLSVVSFPLSISSENLSALISYGFKFHCCNQRGWIIPSNYCMFEV